MNRLLANVQSYVIFQVMFKFSLNDPRLIDSWCLTPSQRRPYHGKTLHQITNNSLIHCSDSDLDSGSLFTKFATRKVLKCGTHTDVKQTTILVVSSNIFKLISGKAIFISGSSRPLGPVSLSRWKRLENVAGRNMSWTVAFTLRSDSSEWIGSVHVARHFSSKTICEGMGGS